MLAHIFIVYICNYPGGHESGLPASRCKWRWKTDCPAFAPLLITILKASFVSWSSAILLAAIRSFPNNSLSFSSDKDSWGISFLGIIKIWIGAWGLISLKAMQKSSSYKISVGISLSIIFLKDGHTYMKTLGRTLIAI